MTNEELYDHFRLHEDEYDGRPIDSGFWGRWFVFTTNLDQLNPNPYDLQAPRHGGMVMFETPKGLLPGIVLKDNKVLKALFVNIYELSFAQLLPFAQYVQERMGLPQYKGHL